MIKKTLIIGQASLKEVTAQLSAIVKGGKILPVLSNVLLSVSKSKATFTGTDLQVTIQCSVTVTGADEFKVLLPFQILKEVVGIAAGNIAIQLEDNLLKVIHANDEINLGPAMDVKEFPVLPVVPKTNNIRLNGEFSAAIRNAALSVSKDDNRPALTYVCLDIRTGKGINVVSTDRFSLYVHNIPFSGAIDAQLLIPPAACTSIGENVVMSFNDKYVSFECDDTTVIVTRGDSKYVDYEKVLGTHNFNMTVVRQDLMNALLLCSLSDNNDRNSTFTISADAIEMKSLFTDNSSYAKSVIPATYSGDVKAISLHNDRFVRALRQLGPSDSVELSVVDAKAVVSLQRPGADSVRCYMIPIFSNPN